MAMKLLVIRLAFVLAALLAALPLLAGDKEKVFDVPPDRAFATSIEVAKEHYTVTAISREDMVLSFRTPAGMRAMTGYDVVATFAGRPEGCGKPASEAGPGQTIECKATVIKLKVSKRHGVFTWGGGSAVANDFFGWLEEKLKLKSTEKSAAAPASSELQNQRE